MRNRSLKILYIGTLTTNKTIEKYMAQCKSNKPTMAGILFDRNVASGINNYCDLEAISLLPIPSFPRLKKIFIKEKQEYYENIKITYLSIFNLPIIKYFFIILNLFFYLIHWNIKNRQEKDRKIILASVDTIFTLPSIIGKKIFKTDVYAVVTDLPDFSFEYRNDIGIIKKSINIIAIKIYNILKHKLDGYIYLSKYMNEKINLNNKPYIVIDGLVNVNEINQYKIENAPKEGKRIVMYAGGLNESYGIKKLVDAFLLSGVDNSELWLFGSGDYEETLKNISQENSKIKFGGQISHRKIIEYEKKVTLLINPRPTNEEYTKYSFPSKTLEYMLSGTPFLTTRIPTLTEEYDEHLFYIENEDVTGISKAISDVLSLDKEALIKKGESAKDFIIKNKNNIVQSKKIVDLITGR